MSLTAPPQEAALLQAQAFSPTVADEFLTALALDMQDHAKADGRALFEKTVVN